jgi:hypothetical protein
MAPGAAASGSNGLLHDRRLLGLLIAGGVTLLVAGAVIGFSGAYFTSTSGSPGNEFAAARMGLELAVPGQIIDGEGMVPGDVRTGDQTVTNTGHRGHLVLEAQGLTSAGELTNALEIRIERTDSSPPVGVYDGALDRLDSLDLGTIETDERRVYTFTVTWPEGQDSGALNGDSTSLVFDWQLESLP